jgi:hypothetical protein
MAGSKKKAAIAVSRQRCWLAVIALAQGVNPAAVFAQHEGQSADEVAKELSNPAGSLASLFTSFEYTTYKGELPDADEQDSWKFTFQPVLPFPVGYQGRKIIFRPLVPVPLNQPVFDADRGGFGSADVNLGDISFDLVYAGNEMKTKHDGFLWGIGAAGTLPTATDDDVGGDQWRLGPEMFGGVVREWGTAGLLLSHQWDVGGSNNETHSVTGGQYFYAFGMGNGWQIAAGPNFSYDWEADSDEAWTFPLGVGLAKTSALGNTKLKLQAQVHYFVEQPDAFGPEWLLKFTATPVIKNPFIRE